LYHCQPVGYLPNKNINKFAFGCILSVLLKFSVAAFGYIKNIVIFSQYFFLEDKFWIILGKKEYTLAMLPKGGVFRTHLS